MKSAKVIGASNYTIFENGEVYNDSKKKYIETYVDDQRGVVFGVKKDNGAYNARVLAKEMAQHFRQDLLAGYKQGKTRFIFSGNDYHAENIELETVVIDRKMSIKRRYEKPDEDFTNWNETAIYC